MKVIRVAGADCHHSYNTAEEAALIPQLDSVVAAVLKLAA